MKGIRCTLGGSLNTISAGSGSSPSREEGTFGWNMWEIGAMRFTVAHEGSVVSDPPLTASRTLTVSPDARCIVATRALGGRRMGELSPCGGRSSRVSGVSDARFGSSAQATSCTLACSVRVTTTSLTDCAGIPTTRIRQRMLGHERHNSPGGKHHHQYPHSDDANGCSSQPMPKNRLRHTHRSRSRLLHCNHATSLMHPRLIHAF